MFEDCWHCHPVELLCIFQKLQMPSRDTAALTLLDQMCDQTYTAALILLDH